MAEKFPLIFDTTENKIKELPSGDDLNLQGNNIVNAVDIESNSINTGNLETASLTVDGSQLADVAFSGSYFDIPDRPSVFDKNYNSLTNKPFIPQIIGDLNDVEAGVPNDGEFLVWKTAENRFAFSDSIPTRLEQYSISELNDVVASNVSEDSFLKYFAGAWRESSIQWTDVKNKPTNVSVFVNDAGYLTTESVQENGITADVTGSVFADSSALLVDAVNGNLPYTPDTDSNWAQPAPESVSEALDRLAAAVAALGTNA